MRASSVFERREHEASAEDEPQDERQQAAGQLGELHRFAPSSPVPSAPNARPPMNAATKGLPPISDGHEEGDQRQSQRRAAARDLLGPAAAGRRAHQRPPHEGEADADGDTDRQLADGAEPVVVVVAGHAEQAAADAMQNVTTGVAMPSFSPLSTFSTRRTRTGSRSSAMTGALNAASVGARLAPIRAARASGGSGTAASGHPVPARIDRGRPDAEQPGGQPEVTSGRGERTVEASAKSSRARVTSARWCTVELRDVDHTIPQLEFRAESRRPGRSKVLIER